MKFSELSKEDQEKILTAVKAEVYMQNLVPTQHFFYVRPVIKAFEEVMEAFEKETKMGLHKDSLMGRGLLREKNEKTSKEIFFPDNSGSHSRRFPYGR